MSHRIPIYCLAMVVLAGCGNREEHSPSEPVSDEASEETDSLDTDLLDDLLDDLLGDYQTDDECAGSDCDTEFDGPDTETEGPESITVSWRIDEDTVWENHIEDPDVPDYVVVDDVSVKALLTVEPGVYVHFNAGASLKIDDGGAIVATGTKESRIAFTGETSPGSWDGILIMTGDVRNELSYIDISYAGGHPVNDVFLDVDASVAIAAWREAAKLTLTHANIENGAGFGLYSGYDARLEIEGELVKMEDIVISGNANAPISLPAGQVSRLDPDSSYGDDNGDAIRINESALQGPSEHTWPVIADGTPYRIVGDLRVSTVLTIEAGAVLEFDPETKLEIDDDGALIALGTEDDPIVLTGTVTSAPSWKGIIIRSGDVRNAMDHAEVSYAGSSNIDGNSIKDHTAIAITGSSAFKLTRSAITNSGGYGLLLGAQASLEESDNVFKDNALDDIFTLD